MLAQPKPISKDSVSEHLWRKEAQISSVSSEDEGYFIEPSSLWHHGFVFVCSVVSFIFSLVYLGVLFVFAIASCFNFPWRRRRRNSDSDNNDEPLLNVEFKDDPSKLVFDLRYYVQLEGYDLEDVLAATDDGFHLEVYHIVVPGESKEESRKRYPVLLVHGLLQSSAAYCTSGKDSLAFELVRAGYDVWLGNNRCGFTPKHTNHRTNNIKMWSWRLGEMGTFDLPCMINRILELKPDFEKVALVAHSQGTAQTFLALAKDRAPELGDKISSFTALAPAVYTGPLVTRWFLVFMRYLPLPLFRLLFGYHSYMPIMMVMHSLLPCKIYSSLGYIVFRYLFSWDDKLWDNQYRDRELLFSPVHISAELMFWWLGKDGFAARGCLFRHELETHPWFNEQFPPLLLVIPGLDDLVNPYKLVSRIEKVETKLRKVEITELPNYSHLDVLWASDVADKVGKPLVRFLEANK